MIQESRLEPSVWQTLALQPCFAPSPSTAHVHPLWRACLKLHKVLSFLQTAKPVLTGEVLLSRIPADNKIFEGCELKNLFAENYCAAPAL